MPMDKALKLKWADALESDKYMQCSGLLTDGSGGYCCLGVLCDIQDPAWVDKYFHVSFDPEEEVGMEEMSTTTVPEELRNGLDPAVADELGARNDGCGYMGVTFPRHSFREIAKLLREREDI